MSIEIGKFAFDVAVVTEAGDKIHFITDDKGVDYFVLEVSNPKMKLNKFDLAQIKTVLGALGQAQITVK